MRDHKNLTESEMSRIELFDSVPENDTYDPEEEAHDLEMAQKMIQALKE